MTPLVDIFDLPDWALAALTRAGCKTAAAAARLAACGKYGYVAGPLDAGDATRVATLLWDLTLFARPYDDCLDAARAVMAAAVPPTPTEEPPCRPTP